MKEKIKIGIVDDSKATLRNLTSLLEYTNKVTITIKAKSGKQFLESLKDSPKGMLPQVVLTDIDMPGMNGIDMVLIAKGRYPAIHFLMLTVYDDEELLFQAIKAGASGYLLKDEKVSLICKHIENLIYNDDVPMSPTMALKTLDLIRKSDLKSKRENDFDTPTLTSREIEVLQLLVDGMNYKKMAVELFVSTNTIKKHISNIYSKLHVTSKAEAIKLSHHYGFI